MGDSKIGFETSSETMTKDVVETESKLLKDIERLDDLALKIEKLGLDVDEISTVSRIAEIKSIWLRRDLKGEEHLNDVASQILKDLAKAGIHLTPKPSADTVYTDYAAIGRREWRLAEGRVALAIFTGYDLNAKCRYVEDGYVTEKKYKIVCDEATVGPETVKDVLAESTVI